MTVAIRPAATVMLVRDDHRGELETLLLRRHPDVVFVAGAHVFPGGRVDDLDAVTTEPSFVSGLEDRQASVQLGVASGGLAYWIAAVRETFEEAGVLLAHPVDGADLSADPALRERLAAIRPALDAGQVSLEAVCRDAGLTLPLGRLRYFGRWITPLGAPRRYDTRFFVAPAPVGQSVEVDGREIVDHEWTRPAAALERFAEGEIDLILPTERSLSALATFTTAAEVLAWLDTSNDEGAEVDDHGGWRRALPSEDTTGRPTGVPVPVGEP